MSADAAVAAKRHSLADGCKWSDAAAGANLRPSLDHDIRADFGRCVHPRFLVDHGGWMDARTGRRDGVEQCRDAGPTLVGRGRHDCYRSGRNPVLHLRVHDDRASHRVFERDDIAPIIEKADLVRAGRLQWPDTREHSLDCGGNYAFRRGRDVGKRVRRASGEKPRIAHRSFDQGWRSSLAAFRRKPTILCDPAINVGPRARTRNATTVGAGAFALCPGRSSYKPRRVTQNRR